MPFSGLLRANDVRYRILLKSKSGPMLNVFSLNLRLRIQTLSLFGLFDLELKFQRSSEFQCLKNAKTKEHAINLYFKTVCEAKTGFLN